MRGIPDAPYPLSMASRITPAHAGNTFLLYGFSSSLWDHPRACGEYRGQVHDFGRLLGSPPRMRGILEQLFRISKNQVITPAHAGNTYPGCQKWQRRRDHPRACGEYPMRRIRFPWRLGSPPRMRGILFCFTVSLLPCGITPAHAGNTEGKSTISADF